MRSSLAVLAGFLVWAAAAQAIDLTPRYITVDADGMSVRRPYFADGDAKYAVTVDRETELAEYEGSALFNFTKFPHAVMRLRQSSLRPDTPFDDLNLPRYREAALKLLIAGAEKPVLSQEAPDVFPINDWQSHKFVFSYLLAGVPMRESITFLDLDEKQQIVVQIRSSETDFPQIAARGEDVVRRWHRLKPGTEIPGN